MITYILTFNPSHILCRRLSIWAILALFYLCLPTNQSFGQIDWNQCMGGIGHEHFNEIIEIEDGNLISIGDKSPNNGNYNADLD